MDRAINAVAAGMRVRSPVTAAVPYGSLAAVEQREPMSQVARTTDEQKDASLARMMTLSVVLGVLAATAASLFVELIDRGQNALFEDLPAALGLEALPWWWAALLLLIGATGVALAQRMPGSTGTGPLTGFHFDDPLRMVPSVLVAALFTLVFGLVLGPEAPLIVLGSAIGAVVARRAEPRQRQAAMLLGGVAAIGAIFGNPFVTGFMILEFAAMGLVPAAILPAVLVALGAGYLTQVGIWAIPGFGVHSLSVPGLPSYDSIQAWDLALGLLLALGAAVVVVIVRGGASAVDRFAGRHRVPALYLAAGVTAVVLLVAEAGFDVGPTLILFSGQAGMGDLVAETSATAVLVILVAKAIAYAFALGGGFRGGPIFPATFLGVAAAVLVSLLLPGSSVTALAAAGIAASAGAMLKLPATSALLGALLVGGGGAGVAPFAIFGAIVGLVVRMAADRRIGHDTDG
jgi:H+/Cl- antiporter ClcA